MEQPDREAMRVFAKGTRAQILAILAERPATPQEVATEIGEENLAIIAYHVGVLRKCGAIEPDHVQQRRDGGRRLYRARR